MKLADYDFKVIYRPGRVHSNADGLTRAAATPNLEPHVTIEVEAAQHAAMFTEDVACGAELADDDELTWVLPTEAPPENPRPLQGPRQLLLEAAPCAACHQPIRREANSLVCDGCNNAWHLGCTRIKRVLLTAWYCDDCRRHIHARGI